MPRRAHGPAEHAICRWIADYNKYLIHFASNIEPPHAIVNSEDARFFAEYLLTAHTQISHNPADLLL